MLCSYQFARAIDGVFEASDEVIGAVESGVDFEKRIAHIYQLCRTAEQISFEFDALQGELEVEIAEGQRDAREKLLNNFDQEVIEKVRCVTMPNQPVPRRSRASGPAPHGSEGRGRQYVPGGTRPEARRQVEQPIMDAVAGRNSGWFDAKPRDRHRAFPKSSRERTSAAST